MALPVYSPRNVVINFLGHAAEGLAPDTFISFQYNTDITDEEVGGDGSVSVSMSPDETGTCTLSLMQESPTNKFLSGVLALQRTNGTIASGSFTIKDPSGAVIAKLSDAHIKTAPTIGLGSTATGSTRDWVIYCQKMVFLSVPEGDADSTGVLADISAAVENVQNFLL